MPTDIDDVMRIFGGMTLQELTEFNKKFQETFDVVDSSPIVQNIVHVPENHEVEVPTEFNVTLLSYGKEKIQVIKLVRELTGLGLKEAKDFVESLPRIVLTETTEDKANEVKEKVTNVGGEVEIIGID